VYHIWRNRNAIKHANYLLTEDQLLQKRKLKVSLHYEQVNLGGQRVMYTFATIGGLMPDSGIGLSLSVLCFDIVCC
jgi:hypothetical protein